MSRPIHQVFNTIIPNEIVAPILISVPHVGIYIPADIQSTMKTDIADTLDDTDFRVDELYDFAADLGIPMITSHYSRYVIDLNRNPENEHLYSDGRNTTSLVPLYDFHRNEIYKSDIHHPDFQEVQERLESYYHPYHEKIESMLNNMKERFGRAFLFDAHSIKRNISEIWDKDFSDLIIGDNDGQSADPSLVNICLEILRQSKFSVAHNLPFKGGYITRKFGRPNNDIHALQLEMSKDLYLDDKNEISETRKVSYVKDTLKELFTALIANLTS